MIGFTESSSVERCWDPRRSKVELPLFGEDHTGTLIWRMPPYMCEYPDPERFPLNIHNLSPKS